MTVDQKYYEVVQPRGIAERLLIRARDQVYVDFIRKMTPTEGQTILDVGISDVVTDGANVLERLYPHQQNITACGLGNAEEFQKEFPAATYVKIAPNKPLPFQDGQFAIATANAVLEHVGSISNQMLFVSEVCRVARKVFISVPHRFFPVEHHTAIPLLHYRDTTFRMACAVLGKSSWTEQQNLILMTRKQLFELAQNQKQKAEVGYTGLKLGPFSSNLYLSLI